MKSLPWKNFFFILFVSLLAAINMKYCLNMEEASLVYSNSIVSFAVWIGICFGLWKIVKDKDWSRYLEIIRPCFIFSLCFVGSMIAGVKLDRQGAITFDDWRMYVAAVCVSLALAPVLAWGVRKLERYNSECRQIDLSACVADKKVFFIVWGVFVLAYIPVFIASFPGFFVYDAEVEVNMVFTETYSAHHPVFHVLLLGWIIRIMYKLTKSYNAGIAVYTFCQMLFISGCFSYTICFLKRIGVKRWICNTGIIFLALFPTVSMFVCCSTKDGIFCGGVLLLCTLLLEMARDSEAFWKQKCKRICFVFAILIILFFRNNGLYAFVVFLIPFALIYKKDWRKWIMPVIVSFLLFTTTTEILKFGFHFEEGEIAEMLCVPMQQLARVHAEKKESFTRDELDTLYSLIPEDILNNYRPKLADDVKVGFNEENLKESPWKYISLWVEKGIKYPDIYINSFLINTYGYWYPDTVLDAYRGRKISELVYEDSSYFGFETERPGTRIHLLPPLERFYKKISLEIYQQKLPVISMFFSIGFWNWCYIFLIFYMLIARHKKQVCALAIMEILYLTVLLGPVALVRYVLYFFYAMPIALALLFDTRTVAGRGAGAVLV